ncbi:MAG: DMT family transporter, partial [Anaerolineales bacterium]|nr:DMT family transporter [Anaerolineales bacterium]
MLSILFGLGAALGWGAADFTGGLASRKTGAYRAVFYGEIVGILALLIVVGFAGESLPPGRVWMMALIAGTLGTIGLLMLYHAMTLGLMSIATPISALLAAALPIVVSIFRDGLPSPTTILGFGFALFAVWMISQSEGGVTDTLRVAHLADLKLPLLAGIGFGCYFIFMHEAVRTSTYWPMVISRTGGLTLTTLFMLFRRDSWKVQAGAWALIVLNGLLDVSGNTFFVIASQAGRL